MKKLTTISIIIVISVFCFAVTSARAEIPHLIGYQGRLTDAQGTPREGSFQVTFRIYDAEAAGNLLWEEAHANVTVQDGIFDILLGSVTPLDLPFNQPYYLAIKVGSDPEMTPRQQIASVGYSYMAEKSKEAETLTQFPITPPSMFNEFGGNGSHGDIVISENTNFSDLSGGMNSYYLQANNLTVDNGRTLTIDTGWAYIAVKGTCVIHGAIYADGRGEEGGRQSAGGLENGAPGRRADGLGDITDHSVSMAGIDYNSPTDIPKDDVDAGAIQQPVLFAVSGAGGGGGDGFYRPGGCGGGAGSYGGRGGQYSTGSDGVDGVSTPLDKIKRLTGNFVKETLMYRGAGGGAGGGAVGTKNGGNGGGVIYIECDTLVFDGTLTADGLDGADGQENNGASGGGGGGVILVRTKNIVEDTGTMSVSGGIGGEGIPGGGQGDGGDGQDGYNAVVLMQ